MDYLKFAADNARREFGSPLNAPAEPLNVAADDTAPGLTPEQVTALLPERFWLHAEHIDLGGHTSYDWDFGTIAEAAEAAVQLVEDGDAHEVTITARHQQIDARYTRDGWDGEDAALMYRCEICGEPAGEGGSLCPACASNDTPADPAYVAYLKGEQPDPRD